MRRQIYSTKKVQCDDFVSEEVDKEILEDAVEAVTVPEDTNVSQVSFDFSYDYDYDVRPFLDSMEKAVESTGVEVLGSDTYSVDYSSYPEFADVQVSQCGVDFEWSGSYSEEAITSAIEEALKSQGCELVGISFESLS